MTSCLYITRSSGLDVEQEISNSINEDDCGSTLFGCGNNRRIQDSVDILIDWYKDVYCLINELDHVTGEISNSIRTYPEIFFSEMKLILKENWIKNMNNNNNKTIKNSKKSFFYRLSSCVSQQQSYDQPEPSQSTENYNEEKNREGKFLPFLGRSGRGKGGGRHQDDSLNGFLVLSGKIVAALVGYLGFRLFS